MRQQKQHILTIMHRCDFRQDIALRMIAHYEAAHPFEWAKRQREVDAEVRMELDEIAFEENRALGIEVLKHLVDDRINKYTDQANINTINKTLETKTTTALADQVAAHAQIPQDPKLATRRQKHWNGVDCEEILRKATSGITEREDDLMHGSSSEATCSETSDMSDSESELEEEEEEDSLSENEGSGGLGSRKEISEVDETARQHPPAAGLPKEAPEPEFQMDSEYTDNIDINWVVEDFGNGIQQRTQKDRYGDNEYKVTRTETHPTAGRHIRTFDISRLPCSETVGPWAPFKSADDFKAGSFFIRHNHTKSSISEGFNRRIYKQPETGELSFASADALRNIVEKMDPDFQASEWHVGQAKFFADAKNELVDFYFRDIATIIKHFFKQPAYRDYLIFAPVKEYNSNNEQVWSDLHTASWWWEQQVCFPFSRRQGPFC